MQKDIQEEYEFSLFENKYYKKKLERVKTEFYQYTSEFSIVLNDLIENLIEEDRILLRNSKARIKRLFRRYYYSRNFKPGDKLLDRDDDPPTALLRNLRGQMFPSPATGMVPWWARGMLRDNPYNAAGTICDGKD